MAVVPLTFPARGTITMRLLPLNDPSAAITHIYFSLAPDKQPNVLINDNFRRFIAAMDCSNAYEVKGCVGRPRAHSLRTVGLGRKSFADHKSERPSLSASHLKSRHFNIEI